jgi:hypothetical protein
MLSFTGALHTVRSFEESHLYDPTRIEADLPRLLELSGKKRVGARPDRYEPRAVKRRPKPYPVLKMPREAAKRLIKRSIIPYKKAQDHTGSNCQRTSNQRKSLRYPGAIRVEPCCHSRGSHLLIEVQVSCLTRYPAWWKKPRIRSGLCRNRAKPRSA